MKIFNVYIKIVAFAAILLTSANSFAVTRQEMDQARTIAAKAYIRYVNDGSGYLDDLNPKTMEELVKTGGGFGGICPVYDGIAAVGLQGRI